MTVCENCGFDPCGCVSMRDMTDDEAMAEIQQAVQRKFFEDLAKLQRYEEREPLVQELLQMLPLDRDRPSMAAAVAQTVRDFKLT